MKKKKDNRKKKILLLNILDKNIKNFINNTCDEYSIKKPTLISHITLRGPFYYDKKPSENIIIKLNKFIDDLIKGREKLVISGVGMFNNNGIYVVYLNVVPTDMLKKLSYKKEYSFSTHGFNPHVTIFSTTDKEKAYKIKNSLESTKIEFSCSDLEWAIHELKSDEKNMFLLSELF